ncbi:hypothetical protein D8674_041330 [Pyrus ussuriensis x Pyrus communis]|uniref:Zinc knuckle CX2CX4HX4C domain-containing protein n=1 Tax=Pyrus ussuriensis x Pyrus communis TaxID=2448454 RepID=A0A5N5G8I4_9ROSA|nr:hypothetical protein D8674_041330 [Pyrus ussuriensis x Pyrus communis]
MTRHIGEFLGNILGEYILMNQNRKDELFGSILRVRVCLDVRNLLQRFVNIQLHGRQMQIDARYEKLPLTCFLCEMMDHVEDQCECYEGKVLDDKDKPYGCWFQLDVLDKDYRRPIGRQFGLDAEGGWLMKAPVFEEVDALMEVEEGKSMETGAVGQGISSILDLNEAVSEPDSKGDQVAVVPFMSRALGRQFQDMLEDEREGLVTAMR